MNRISVCIATYQRPGSLGLLLQDLHLQSHQPDEVVVVDNDALGSARLVVERYQALGVPYAIHYEVQAEKNISLTRNRCVALATGEWLAFIDDDERAPPDWLTLLWHTAQTLRADAVQAPVVPRLPADTPTWIRRGHFYDYPRLPTGCPVPRNRLRLGNLLLKRALLKDQEPFNPEYGLTGGEDGDLLSRLSAAGAHIFWCDEAVVIEPVVHERLSLRWLLRRSLRGGQDFARHSLSGRYGKSGPKIRAWLFVKSSIQLSGAILLCAAALPFGRCWSARWLISASANLGKISQLWGWHYREYA